MKNCLRIPYFTLFFGVLALLLSLGSVAAQGITPPTLLWQFTPSDGAIFGSALSDDGAALVVVIGYGFDPGGTVVSLDPATGDVRWSVDIPESPWSDPVIADGIVYAGIGSLISGQSAVYAFEVDTGAQLWRNDVTNRDLPATPIDGVAIGDASLYVNRADGAVLALDMATGAERWSVDVEKPQRGAPFVDGDTVYISTGFDGAVILALDTASGDERWRFEQPVNPVTGPVVAEGLLSVGFVDGDVVTLDPATGEERWRALGGVMGDGDLEAPSPGLPLIANGVLYVSGNGFAGAHTVALDAATGANLWTAATGNFSASAPALDGNVLLVGSDSGDLLGLDLASGAELWRVAIPNKIDIDLNQDEPPLVFGNRFFAGDDAGGLVACGWAAPQ